MTDVEELAESEDQVSYSGYTIDDPIFSANLFWNGGSTHTLRLDEIRSMQERQLKGEDVMVGDTSARQLVESLFKWSNLLHKPIAERLIKVLAEALLKEMAGDPTKYLNELHDHPTRQAQMRAVGALAETEPKRDRGLVSGYAKPEDPDKVDYNKLKVEELKAELEKRNLPTDGKKDDLVGRLEVDDLTRTDVDTP